MKDALILTIQDISCVGQCSLTVALPVVSACGVETAILPSAVLSTHTGGFRGYTFRDLSADMPAVSAHWRAAGIAFDAVYTGYLGSLEMIATVKAIMESNLRPGGLRVVDPAMADNGRLYAGFSPEYARAMGELCGSADIALPNITEACFMTGTPYDEGIAEDRSRVEALLDRVASLGSKSVVLKGAAFEPGRLGVAVRRDGATRVYLRKKLPKSYHGTGDIFASALVGSLMRGKSLYDAARVAADFTAACIENTMGDDAHWYGVKFEKLLPELAKRLDRA